MKDKITRNTGAFIILFLLKNVRLNVRLNIRLSDIQNQIIILLKENPRLNAQEISIKLEKSKKTIERAGSKRDGYWIVIE